MSDLAEMVMPLLYGRMTRLVDPSDFWLQTGSEEDLKNFKDFEKQLNSAALQLPMGSIEDVVEGSMVLVQCSGHDSKNTTMWKRATVIRTDRERNTFDVFYIDYGTTEIVPSRRVCPRMSEDIQQYPSICYRCALAGINPIAKSWTTRGIKTFEKLTSQRLMKVAFVSYDSSAMSHRVTLYQTDAAARSVTHYMLDAETGLPTEEDVKEYAKDVVPITFEALYGNSIDSEQSWEMVFGISNVSGTFTEETRNDQQSSVSSSEPPPSISQGQLGYADQHDQNQGHKPASRMHVDSEHTSTSDNPEAVVVPRFDVTGLKQRHMPSAEELQREQDTVRKAMHRAKLQKDMIQVHQDLNNLQSTYGQGQEWGCSDLQLAYLGMGPVTQRSPVPGCEVEDREKSTARCGTAASDLEGDVGILSLYPEDKGLKPCQDYIFPKQTKESPSTTASVAPGSPAQDTAVSHDIETTGDNHCFDEDVNVSHSDHTEGASSCPAHGVSSDEQQWLFPPPPQTHPSWNDEELEYRKQQYVKQILQEAVQVDGIQREMVCAHIHSFVPLDVDHNKKEMKMLIEVLLEEAVKNESVREIALAVFSSYSNVLKGEELMDVLKYGADKFVRIPVGKMSGFHMEFAGVMIQLLFLAFHWPLVLKTVIEDFILSCVERWIVFNRKGVQTSLFQRQLEEVYIACADLILPDSKSILQTSNPERIVFILEQMREKVLETEVRYHVRSCLLNLLLKVGEADHDPNQLQLTEDIRLGEKKRPTSDQGTQMEYSWPSSPQISPSPTDTDGSMRKMSVVTAESGCQTDDLEAGGDRAQCRHAVVQTDDALGTVLFRRCSSGEIGLATSETLDSVIAAPGRARRKRAVLEYLHKQAQETGRVGVGIPQSSSAASSPGVSPDIKPQCVQPFTSATNVFSQEMGKFSANDPEVAEVKSVLTACMKTVEDSSSLIDNRNSDTKNLEGVGVNSTSHTTQSHTDTRSLQGVGVTSISHTTQPHTDTRSLQGVGVTSTSHTTQPHTDTRSLQGVGVTSTSQTTQPHTDTRSLQGVGVTSTSHTTQPHTDTRSLQGVGVTSTSHTTQPHTDTKSLQGVVGITSTSQTTQPHTDTKSLQGVVGITSTSQTTQPHTDTKSLQGVVGITSTSQTTQPHTDTRSLQGVVGITSTSQTTQPHTDTKSLQGVVGITSTSQTTQPHTDTKSLQGVVGITSTSQTTQPHTDTRSLQGVVGITSTSQTTQPHTDTKSLQGVVGITSTSQTTQPHTDTKSLQGVVGITSTSQTTQPHTDTKSLQGVVGITSTSQTTQPHTDTKSLQGVVGITSTSQTTQPHTDTKSLQGVVGITSTSQTTQPHTDTKSLQGVVGITSTSQTTQPHTDTKSLQGVVGITSTSQTTQPHTDTKSLQGVVGITSTSQTTQPHTDTKSLQGVVGITSTSQTTQPHTDTKSLQGVVGITSTSQTTQPHTDTKSLQGVVGITSTSQTTQPHTDTKSLQGVVGITSTSQTTQPQTSSGACEKNQIQHPKGTCQDVCVEDIVGEFLQKSQQASASPFITAVSSVSQAAYKAVFCSSKDERHEDSTAPPVAVCKSDSFSNNTMQREVKQQCLPGTSTSGTLSEEKRDSTAREGKDYPARPAKKKNNLTGEPDSPSNKSCWVPVDTGTESGYGNKAGSDGNFDAISGNDSSDGNSSESDMDELNVKAQAAKYATFLIASKGPAAEESYNNVASSCDCVENLIVQDFDNKVTYDNRGSGNLGFGEDGTKWHVKKEDFPPLPQRPLSPRNLCEKPKLTLNLIAANVLRIPSPEKDEKKNRIDIGANEVYVSDEDDVPSDWEDRDSSETGGHVKGINPNEMDRDSLFDTGQYGQGDWSKEKHSGISHRALDAAGDSSVSQLVAEYSIPASRVFDAGDTGHLLSPPGLDDGSFPLKDTESPSSMLSSGSDVPYQRKDLTRFAELSSKSKKRTKYHPLHSMQATRSSHGAFGTDIPCSNCGVMGHVRMDCPEPQKSLFF